ncbi:MAG TPA: LLM class flavin-dependent oxidoreductase [Devosiaceae bacterium]|nr:LLM class flavin-dependent oxidoreductase [Devosiaceae bacterium]
MPELPLSILDLAPVPVGTSSSEALARTVSLAKLGDELGYTRLWYAEHHGMPMIASSSPDILIASAAAHTSRIRVGSGGVMLPNHVPLRVAEDFRTLAALYPNRIDLGIGRAGGTDSRTLNALRSFGGEHFSEQMAELLAFERGEFPEGHPFKQVRVVPDQVALPPIWLLGSSGASAAFAGGLGLGYGFAAHFSTTPARPAFEAYRDAFRPSDWFDRPQALICLSVVCAPTDEEALYLAGPQTLSWVLFHTGRARRLVSPEEAAAYKYSPEELDFLETQKGLWIVGSPETVKREILAKVEQSGGADEVMVTTTMFGHEDRLRSYRLLASAFGLTAG